MDLETDKINRQPNYLFVPAFDGQDSTGKNNHWKYNRAPDGYKFILHSVDLSCGQYDTLVNGIFAIFDGHEYTHWNLWPGVESAEILGRVVTNSYQLTGHIALNGWECKEFTLANRSTSSETAYKVCAIVWYHLEMMTKHEREYYAVIQPKSEHFRKGGPRTLTEGEETV